ncbi:unnamed protein product [Coregonus sp. 'balchen']|nr:unnamed protein product [Coregonus sp. 'balchen']
MWLLIFARLLHCVSAYDVDLKKLDGLHIPGAEPELVLLNHYYEELDRIALSDMARSEINELLEKLGFYKKAQPEDEVPEEFRFSPAKDRSFKGTPKSQSSPSSAPTDNASFESDAEAKHSDL